MWSLIALAIAAFSPDPKPTVIANETRFGPRQHLTCEWFSNFENSRFEKCRVRGGRAADLGEGASLECLSDTCEQLDAKARRITRWNKPEPVWGTFTVQLYGRLSTSRRKKRHLGDGTSTVLVEKLVSVRER